MYISILGAHKAKTEVFLEKADIPTKLPLLDDCSELHLLYSDKFDFSLQLFEVALRLDNVWIGLDVLQTIHHECNGRNELLPAVYE